MNEDLVQIEEYRGPKGAELNVTHTVTIRPALDAEEPEIPLLEPGAWFKDEMTGDGRVFEMVKAILVRAKVEGPAAHFEGRTYALHHVYLAREIPV